MSAWCGLVTDWFRFQEGYGIGSYVFLLLLLLLVSFYDKEGTRHSCIGIVQLLI